MKTEKYIIIHHTAPMGKSLVYCRDGTVWSREEYEKYLEKIDCKKRCKL